MVPPEDDLSPEAQYTVFHPSEVELADTITADQLREWKAEYPGAVVVSYVNTTAAVKAETEERREGELKTDSRDSSAPFHPDRESRPTVGFLTHRGLRVFPRSPSNRQESSRLARQRPLTVAVARQENRGIEETTRGGNLRTLDLLYRPNPGCQPPSNPLREILH